MTDTEEKTLPDTQPPSAIDIVNAIQIDSRPMLTKEELRTDTEEKTLPDTQPPSAIDSSTVELASLVPDAPRAPMLTKEELLNLTLDELQDLPRFYYYDETNHRVKDSTHCFRCVECGNCDRCLDCVACDGCSDCNRCIGCVHCYACVRCYNCEDCYGCLECIGISDGNALCHVAYGIQLTEAEFRQLLETLNRPKDEEAPDSSEGEESGEQSDDSDEG